MYYEPEYFKAPEIFSPSVYHAIKTQGNKKWRLMDGRILWSADKIRVHFCGPKKKNAADVMYINTWGFGGGLKYRGFRGMIDIIEAAQNNEDLSDTSQHCFGRGLDYSFRYTKTAEVIEDIQKHPNADRYQHITGLELGVSWVHNDTRCWDKGSSGIFTFNR